MKMKKSVQVAEAKTQGPESEQSQPMVSPVHGSPGNGPGSVEHSLPIDVSSVNPQVLGMAEKFGIPLNAILTWAKSVEQRLTAIQESLPKEIGQALDQAIARAREQQKPVAQPQDIGASNPSGLQVPAWGQALPDLIGLIRDAVKDQPQQTNILQELAMESLKEDISFTKTFKQAIKSKFASAATDEIVSKVTGE